MGYYNRNKSVSGSYIELMEQILEHRGPNDNGTELISISTDKDIVNCAIGFDRLSIRDLSLTGHQPMKNNEGDVIIAFNGEIYNADEYRDELKSLGYVFRGHSDTEVILYLYQAYGIDEMLRKLDGMYAICLVDKREDVFYLIRDRLGEKPLYTFTSSDGTLMFASEYKAFYCHPEFKAELNESALDEYFLFRYVTGGDTFLKGVYNLTPGTYLRIDGKEIKQVKYWSIPDVAKNKLSKEENKKRFLELLNLSIKRRLIADVKVGVQLSGGIDSSYLSMLAQKYTDEKLQTFSITFDDKKFSEEPYVDIVNEKFGFLSHKYKFTPDRFFDCWRECTWYFEQPMNHEGTVALLFLNKRAKDCVTVMLCGEGADETLGGYDRFGWIAYYLKHKLRFKVKRLLQNYSSLLHFKPISPLTNIDERFITQTQYVSNNMFMGLRNGNVDRILKVVNKRKRILNASPGKGVRKYMNYEVSTYMSDILMRADKVSMAASLEVRVPFIMPELVEFSSTIPDEYLVLSAPNNNSFHTKRLLKELSEEAFGHDFTYRKKCGFSVPVMEYFNSPQVVEYIETSILPSIKNRKVVNYDFICNLWNTRNTIGATSWEYHDALWTTFSFELWAQMYLDNSPLDWKHIDI